MEREVVVAPITIAAPYAATSMLIHIQNTCLNENKQFDSTENTLVYIALNKLIERDHINKLRKEKNKIERVIHKLLREYSMRK